MINAPTSVDFATDDYELVNTNFNYFETRFWESYNYASAQYSPLLDKLISDLIEDVLVFSKNTFETQEICFIEDIVKYINKNNVFISSYNSYCANIPIRGCW